MAIYNNIHDVALIFEGGGMRASFSAGILNSFLEAELYFNYVTGVSAGASCTINYLSRDRVRARRSFVEIVQHPSFGGWNYFFRGKGYFNADWIYEKSSYDVLPFDIKTFNDNPAQVKISAIKRTNAEVRFWEKSQLRTVPEIVKAVRASSTLPLLMPPPTIDGESYYDGGLRNGLELETAQNDGFKRFVVVMTRERGYLKAPQKHQKLLRYYFRKSPQLFRLMSERHLRYNRTVNDLKSLEKRGQAFLIYPEKMKVNSGCRDFGLLEENYRDGLRQGRALITELEGFLKK